MTESIIVILLEADGIFEGHQRIRLCKSKKLVDLKDVIYAYCNNNEEAQLQWYDPSLQSFRALEDPSVLLPFRHCRLRLVCKRKDSLLQLIWRRFPFKFDQGEFKINNKPLYLDTIANSDAGTAFAVWDGSVVLAQYLEANPKVVAKKTVLELGSGSGLVGIAAAMLNASKVILTDLPYAIPHLKHNISLNNLSTMTSAMELDWFSPSSLCNNNIDVILASDVVWIEALILPLVQTLDASTRNRRSTEIIISHQSRSRRLDEMFFKYLKQHQFNITKVERSSNDNIINIYKVNRMLC